MTKDLSAPTTGAAGVVHARRRRRRRHAKLVIAVVAGALAVPTVAGAQPIDGPGSPAANPNSTGQDQSSVVLRRDGSKAEPFVANIGGTSTTANGDDFAWGDAAIGAGAALGLIALASGGIALRRRGTYSTRSVPTGS